MLHYLVCFCIALQSMMISQDEIDHVKVKSCDSFTEDGEDMCLGRTNSDEGRFIVHVKLVQRIDFGWHLFCHSDTTLVTNWELEESNILGCGNFGIVSVIENCVLITDCFPMEYQSWLSSCLVLCR